MRKIRGFLNFDREEEWLSKMSRKGYLLKQVKVGYIFEKIEPSENIFRIDVKSFANDQEREDYLLMYEDFGWNCLDWTGSGSKEDVNIYYFHKVKKDASDDLFSDKASKYERYRLSMMLWKRMMNILAPVFFILLITKSIDYSKIFSLNSWIIYTDMDHLSGVKMFGAILINVLTICASVIQYFGFPLVLLGILYMMLKSKKMYEKYHENHPISQNE